MDRTQRSEQTYARLFGPRDTTAPDLDPEFGAILRRLIFGEVFHTGDLDERTRELITVTDERPAKDWKVASPEQQKVKPAVKNPGRAADQNVG